MAVAAQSAFVPLVGGRSPTDDGLSPTLSLPQSLASFHLGPGARALPLERVAVRAGRNCSPLAVALPRCAARCVLALSTCATSLVSCQVSAGVRPVGRSRCDCEPRETRPARSQCRRELVFQAHNTKWRWTPKFVRPLALGRCMHDCPDQPLARSINHPSVDNTQASGFF